jgi:hypothetical protein
VNVWAAVCLPQVTEALWPKILFADARDSLTERRGSRVERRVIHGDQHHHQLRVAVQEHSRRADPSHARHHDIHKNEPRRETNDSAHGILARAGFADQHEPTSSGDQATEDLAEDCIVVDDKSFDGVTPSGCTIENLNRV